MESIFSTGGYDTCNDHHLLCMCCLALLLLSDIVFFACFFQHGLACNSADLSGAVIATRSQYSGIHTACVDCCLWQSQRPNLYGYGMDGRVGIGAYRFSVTGYQ